MLKGITNYKLILLLGGLVAVYFIVDYTGGKGRSKSYRSTLVEIDTAEVSAMEIEKEGKLLKITRTSGNEWQLELENGKQVAAKGSNVKSSLLNLMSIKPSRLASKDPANWKDYQVDSAGTRVKVFHNDDKALDIILGRFGVKDQRSYHTFVRLEEDNEVYTVDNFMGISFSTDAASFRDQMFFRMKKDSIHTIRFAYPDSAFTLTKSGESWLIDGQQPTDSTKTAEYMKNLSFTTSKGFVDDIDNFGQPSFNVTLSADGEDDLVLSGYNVTGRRTVLNSSLNPTAYFEDQALIDKFLLGRSYFITSM